MIPVILQVHVDRGQWVDVPVTPETSCRDVIECCREPGDERCRLVQTMGFKEEAIPLGAQIMSVLRKWGKDWPQLSFHLEYADSNQVVHQHSPGSRPFSLGELVENKERNRKLPEGGDMSLTELRQMAARQQHQIEAHQQLLVAKEQRLKFLKQQEVRHQQQQGVSLDADRLRHLREKVELQELKLRRLRALRGQVEQHRSNNTNLSAELESIRALFNEKEKELSMAVTKVEELTRQLEDVRRGDMKGLRQGSTPSPAALEFQKLRRELLYRSKLNEQQNARIAQQRETLAKRQSEISQMDQRIAELQQRLQRKRHLNQQLSSQLHAASRARPRPANIAAVEPLKRAAQEIELIQDDIKMSNEPVNEFMPNKKDPKYQTLPYNTKFTGVNNNKGSPTLVNGELEKHVLPNSGPPPYPEPPPSRFQSPNKPSPPQGLGNLSPRPFGSTYSTSLLSSESSKKIHHQQQSHLRSPVTNSVQSSSVNTSASPSTTNSHSKLTTTSSTSGALRSKLPVSYSPHQTILPPTVMTSRTVPQTPARQHPSPGFGALHHRLNDSTKPAVPPKPGNQNKPVPPPRQIHGVAALLHNPPIKPDTVDQALSVLKGSNRGTENSRFTPKFPPRGGPQRLLPQYQHPPKKSDLHSEANKENSSESDSSSTVQSSVPSKTNSSVRIPDGSNVHISINRRIGMPPAFYFPENQPPPSDLSSCESSDRSSSSSSLSSATKRRPIIPEELQLHDRTNHDSSPSSDINSPKVGGSSPISSKESSVSGDATPKQELSSDSPSQVSPVSDTTDRALSDQDSSGNDKPAAIRRVKKGNLKTKGAVKCFRRVSFDPLALLLDAALEGELELVKKTAKEVANPSAANDEGITALHNAICAGHFEIVKFLVEFGCDVNAQDSDGWTPLHCAASCNNVSMVKYLVEHGACIFATTFSDHETAAEKCEEDEEGFDGCSEYLYSMQEKLGILNQGVAYALYDYEGQNSDELSFQDGDQLIVLRKGDDLEREWWWSKHSDREGYVPRNLLGLYPRTTVKREQ